MNPTTQVLAGFLLRNLSQFDAIGLNLVASPAGLPTAELIIACPNLSLTTADWQAFSAANQFNLAASFAYPLDQLNFNPANWATTPSQLVFWPKAKEEGYFWLAALQQAGVNDLYLAGENNGGVQSAAKNLAKLGAQVTKLDAAKRCSLFAVNLLDVDLTAASGKELSWQLADFTPQPIQLVSQVGVFSHGRLDEGTRLLLSCLSEQDWSAAQQKSSMTALDLGCGYGVLATALAQHLPQVQLTLSDINAFALSASSKTLAANNLSQQAQLVGADVFAGLEAVKPAQGWDLIVTNPPFHQGKAVSYAASEALIRQAKSFLSPQGQLWLVANSFLPYADLLDAAFGSHYQLVQATTRFKVYLARNANF